MPQQDQDILYYLESTVTSLSDEVRRYSKGLGDVSNDFADKVERSFNDAAESIRQTVYGSEWIPASIKPSPPPPKQCPVQLSYLERAGSWMDRNRALTAAIVAFIGTGSYLIWHHRRQQRWKRRARRAPNGAKTELVVLAGSPYSPITKSIAYDLERKGFLVYIPVGTLEEEAAIAEMRAPDIHSLNFDITSTESSHKMLDKLRDFLQNPQRHGTKRLHFASLILVNPYPSTHPSGQVTDLSPSVWSDILNTHILYPISLAHSFLPLLISESKTHIPPTATSTLWTSNADIVPPTTLLVITSSSLPSLNPPLHAPESLTTAALTSYLTTLRTELPLSISLSHIRLGAFTPFTTPFSNVNTALARLKRLRSSSASSSEKSSSSPPTRRVGAAAVYPQASTTSSHPSTSSSTLRELHNGVFDTIVGRRSGTIFLGRGARTYAYVGTFVPNQLVAWMMGHRQETGGRRLGGDESDGEEWIARSLEWERVEESS